MCICKGLTSSILSNLPGIYIYGLAELGLLCVARIDQASKNKTTNQASISSMIYIINKIKSAKLAQNRCSLCKDVLYRICAEILLEPKEESILIRYAK